MKRFEVTDLDGGVKRLRRTTMGDDRGLLSRLFCAEELAEAGWHKPVAQMNWVENGVKGIVRGLHYQAAPHAETKILFCMAGTMHDVVVDVRRGSLGFLKPIAVQLEAGAGDGLLIPAGFAHGYQCLTDAVHLVYLHDALHVPGAERGLNVQDPELNINWPLPIEKLSERDQKHALLDVGFAGEAL